MKYIAHRGLLNGPNPELENTEHAIMYCLENNIDVEIDVWFENEKWYLGHDGPQYLTTFGFISQPNLWIHSKNFEASHQLLIEWHSDTILNFFWHEQDERTLTSHGYWWTYMQKELGSRSIAVLPEVYTPIDNLRSCLEWNCFGICTDYVNKLRF